MVLGSLMGYGAEPAARMMKNKPFQPEEILYVGLQGLHGYQENFLKERGVKYQIQTENFVPQEEIKAFAETFDHILVHFDVDVLDEHLFHSTYFANPELVGDGSGGGKMTMEQLTKVLHCIAGNSNIVGFTIAEYLPFDEYKLHQMFAGLGIFTE